MVGGKVSVTIKRQHEVSLPYQCQYSGYELILQFCKRFPLGETESRAHGIFLYNFIQLHMNIQVSQN